MSNRLVCPPNRCHLSFHLPGASWYWINLDQNYAKFSCVDLRKLLSTSFWLPVLQAILWLSGEEWLRHRNVLPVGDLNPDYFGSYEGVTSYAVRKSGTPNHCFLQNICSEKQIFPRIFFCLRTTKKFLDYSYIHVQFSKLI